MSPAATLLLARVINPAGGGEEGERLQIGDRVRIIPNQTCEVTNLFDTMVFHRDGVVTRVEDVAARGLVW